MSYAIENGAVPISPVPVEEKIPSPVFQIPPCRFRNAVLRKRHPTSIMSSETSAEDDPLYMASKTDLKTPYSLSPTVNCPLKKRTRKTEADAEIENAVARKNMAWDIIDKEISEWQNICQKDRPTWCSPVSKWTRSGARSTWQDELHAISPWHTNLDYIRRPKQRYDTQRRAVTDSYLVDNDNVQGLAHLIAVQLLSACFTLPPDYTSSYKSSGYHCFDRPGAGDILDSRLISSLRMHIEVRYSPAFGHEARNTSPECRRNAAYDGSSRPRSRTQSSNWNFSDSFNFNKSFDPRKIRGALHASEGSAADYLLDCHERGNQRSTFLKAARPRTEPDRNIQSCPSSPGNLDFYLPRRLQLGPKSAQLCPNDAQHRSDHYKLPLLIRPEPHGVYLRPAKDIIVKQWRNLRCRFGERLRRRNLDSLDAVSLHMPVASASSSSTRGETTLRGQIFDGKVKERVRHTRERSDIHSSSMASSPRYNTPTSVPSSGITSPAQFELAYQYVQAPEKAIEEPGTSLNRAISPLSSQTLSNLEAPLTIPSPQIIFNNSPFFGVEPSISTSPVLSSRKPSQSVLPFSKSHSSQRRQRRSMLSEVFTPDDIEERNALSVRGSALTSPIEGPILSSTTKQSPSAPSQSMEAGEVVSDETLFLLNTAILSQMERQEVTRRPSVVERPPIFRMNTNGSQVFKPAEDGVEVDGLPAGPPAEAWDEVIGVTRMREKSFL